MKINKKGFTLVELLAVIVILVTILLVAIPSITSTLERSKAKQLDAKKKLIVSAAEIYVSDNKNMFSDATNYICISNLLEEGLLLADEVKDSDNNTITGCVIYTKGTPDTYNFAEFTSCKNKCS